MRFSPAITEYSFDCKVRKMSARTIGNYQKQLRYLQRYLEQEFQVGEVEEVRSFHIKQFLSMMDDKGKKARYINDLLKVFRTFFNYLKREGSIQESPTAHIKNMKQPNVRIMTFSEEEIRRLLNYFSGRTFLSIRNRAILAMFFDTGMRLSEVTTLCPHQIREDHIIVHGKGNKERLVPVSPYLAKTLMQYRMVRESYFEGRLPEKYLFVSHRGRQLTQEGITKFMKKAAQETGVNCNIRISPHTCRHTFAHLQLKNGLDLYSLSRLMGHESVSITQRYLEGIRDDQVLMKAQKTGVLSNL
ncbi:MAG: tyrosine-type recombinase/integrase [Faecalibacterium sp.]